MVKRCQEKGKHCKEEQHPAHRVWKGLKPLLQGWISKPSNQFRAWATFTRHQTAYDHIIRAIAIGVFRHMQATSSIQSIRIPFCWLVCEKMVLTIRLYADNCSLNSNVRLVCHGTSQGLRRSGTSAFGRHGSKGLPFFGGAIAAH